MKTTPMFAVYATAPVKNDEVALTFVKHLNANNTRHAIEVAKRSGVVAPVIGPAVKPARKAR